MRQHWLILGMIAALLSGCTTPDKQKPSPLPAVPTQDVLGAEPRYEPYHPSANNDYQMNGHTYHIVQNPSQFSETGYASWYGEESSGKMTAIGERFNPYALTAAHPTLPIPSYVRVTNLSNGRMMIVRVNDRGPYKPGRIIELSKASSERLNLTQSTKVKVDFIEVAQDGSVSGPGTIGSQIVKQSYALPGRPTLTTSPLGTPTMENVPDQTGSQPLTNQQVEQTQSLMAQPETTEQLPAMKLQPPKPVTNSTSIVTAPTAASANGFMVQVGAVSSEQRAKEWQQTLAQRFNVQGRVTQHSNVYRVQLGPFNNRQQAADLQQKLADQIQQSSFIVSP
ncbi:septal ring lytic transglycosylase RlpA [Photorhabdus luminescens]|uniref:Endolytic peptidoglycan transglycosylase RlpA n=1 Tax=Photorhabdus akhurstii TaxID=171438 RepID=A0ABX8LT44_9GAMM|nr:endolytic peptidoglycan transglycosylase RlpA [Photorhabdus akhurstii]QXF32860.1 septal ring lytic transglycosylase RlpA [Photorhabdus akhurstii]UJD74658.1 septal ring lytic transglycosylase RlpA [Photorhabdus luminescens]